MIINKSNINNYIVGTIMNCSKQNVTHIEYIPDGITELHCYGNQLTSLPNLPSTLKELDCHNNKITSLPILPNNLRTLFCGNNELGGNYPTDPFDEWVVKHNNRLRLHTRKETIRNLMVKKIIK
jgi:Leucine-rich repeat (LRR) protein